MSWFTREVVPKVRQISLEMAAEKGRELMRDAEPQPEPSAIEELAAQPPAALSAIVERLDAIILCGVGGRRLQSRSPLLRPVLLIGGTACQNFSSWLPAAWSGASTTEFCK